jgi:hypothetical protein
MNRAVHQPDGQPKSTQTLIGSTRAGPNLKIPSKGWTKPGWVWVARWTPGPIIILSWTFQAEIIGYSG